MVKGEYIFGHEEEARQVLPGLCTYFKRVEGARFLAF